MRRDNLLTARPLQELSIPAPPTILCAWRGPCWAGRSQTGDRRSGSSADMVKAPSARCTLGDTMSGQKQTNAPKYGAYGAHGIFGCALRLGHG
jgi:hypothetical protein